MKILKRAFADLTGFALSLICLAPIVAVLAQVDRETLATVILKKAFTQAVQVTLLTSAVGALLSVVIGVGFARLFAYFDLRQKRLKRVALLIPYLVPNFVLATAYVLVWNPGTGLFNTVAPFPFGLYGQLGITVLFAVSHMPIAFLMLEEKFRRIDASLREAARLSGASDALIFRRIEFPILIPSLLSAFAVTFALNVAAFAIPAWIGAPERVYTLSYKVYQSIQIGGLDAFPQAAAYGLSLFAMVVPMLALLAMANRAGRKSETIGGKASRSKVEELTTIQRLAADGLYWIYQLVSWVAPLGALFLSTLVRRGCLQAEGLRCFREITVEPYHYVLFGLGETAAAFRGSFGYGALSSIIIVIIALLVLIMVRNARISYRLSEFAMVLASASPGAIIALGLIMVASGRFGLNLYNTAGIVVAAFIIKHLNLLFQSLRTGFETLSSSLSEAARLSGASPIQVWTKILLPILRPEIVGGFFLVLIPIVGELTMSVFLVNPNFHSIGTLLFDLQDYADQPSAAALSMILIGSVLVFNEIAYRATRGRVGY